MKRLQVPENIALRWEAWPGMGKKELSASVVITVLVSAAAIIFCLLSTWELDVLAAMVSITVTFGLCTGLFTKMQNNQSIYDYIKQRSVFMHEQQTYRFTTKEMRLTNVEEETN